MNHFPELNMITSFGLPFYIHSILD